MPAIVGTMAAALVMLRCSNHRAGALLVTMLASACAGTPSRGDEAPTAKPERQADAAAAARSFQVEYERELLEDPRSFLTVVASFYLREGEQLQLARVDDAMVVSAAGELQFSATSEALLVHGLGRDERIEERALVELGEDGRWAWACSRQEQDWRVLIHDRDAPSRTGFAGIRWFAVDPAWIVEARFEPAASRSAQLMQTSRGATKTLYLAGTASFEVEGQALQLQVFAYELEAAADEPLLIPFRDQTSGRESYPPGRYLEPTLPAGQSLLLDFNRATNPLCAYSEHYNCPVPPRANTLPVAVRAGAMTHE